MSIGAYKLGTIIKVSDELLNDSVFNLESYIATEFARRIGAKEEEAFFTGDGSGKPTGILAAAGGAQTGVTTASATAITVDEMLDLFYSLRGPYRKNAFWVLNDSTVKAIRKLKDGQGRSFKKLSELYAATGQVGFLGSQRVDGKLILPEAIKVLKQKAS